MDEAHAITAYIVASQFALIFVSGTLIAATQQWHRPEKPDQAMLDVGMAILVVMLLYLAFMQLGRVDGIPDMRFWRIPESGFVRITA